MDTICDSRGVPLRVGDKVHARGAAVTATVSRLIPMTDAVEVDVGGEKFYYRAYEVRRVES